MKPMSYQVKHQLLECQELFKRVFGNDLLGIYLYGSLILGGLQKYSDLDLLVVTNRAVTLEEKKALAFNLLRISGIYMKEKEDKLPLEVTVINKFEISPWKYPPHFEFQYGEWLRTEFEKENVEIWHSYEMPDLAILLTQVILKSKTLFGPNPHHFMNQPPFADFIAALSHDLDRLELDLYNDTRNVLLTLCRIWFTVNTLTITSKPAAADWSIKHLPGDFSRVIQHANLTCMGIEKETWDDVKDFLMPCCKYMIEKIRERIFELNLKNTHHTMIKIDETLDI